MIDAANTALAELETSLSEQTRTVQREQQWASFVAEMEDLDDGALQAALDEAVEQAGITNDLLAEAVATTAESAQALDEAETAYITHFNPVVLARRSEDEAFFNWLRDQGLRPTEATEPPSEATDPAPAEAPSSEAETDSDTSATPSRVRALLSAERQRRDQLVVRRLQYYRNHAELRAALQASLLSYQQAVGAEREAVEAALAAARQAWGSATMLQTRNAQQATPDTALAEVIAPWLDRQAVTALQDQATKLATVLQDLEARQIALAETPQDEAMVTALTQWDEQASLIIERFTDYLSLREQYSALGNIEALDELERRMLDRDISNRIAQDLGVYRELGSYFSTEESATVDELLHRYYSRLIALERQVANLESRKSMIEAAATLTEELKTTLQPISERLTALVATSSQDLLRETTKVQAALSPTEAPTLLTAFAEETGTEIDPTTVPKLPTTGDEDELAEARRLLLESLRDEWAGVNGYQDWLQTTDADIQPLGGIDDRVGQLRDLLAELESAEAELNRTIARLTGYDAAEMDKLLSTGAAGTRNRTQLALGEIGLLQQEREQLLHWRMVESGISLVLIPLVAFMIILLIRSIGRRLVVRAIKTGLTSEDEQREQDDRAATVSGILTKVAGTVVTILAIIYMLGVVNIDVTLVIASLGVFGVAVAFGAQSLMKDVFAGFFLLLENQLNRGDWVTINGLVGQVQEIGLRLTIIRDFTDGQLHFIPNGTISQVSNYNKEWSRINVRISTPYEVDPDQVYAILEEVAEQMKADAEINANIKDIAMSPAVATIDYELGCLCFGVFVDVRNATFGLAWTYRMRAKKALEQAGIPLAIAKRIEIEVPAPGGIDGLMLVTDKT